MTRCGVMDAQLMPVKTLNDRGKEMQLEVRGSKCRLQYGRFSSTDPGGDSGRRGGGNFGDSALDIFSTHDGGCALVFQEGRETMEGHERHSMKGHITRLSSIGRGFFTQLTACRDRNLQKLSTGPQKSSWLETVPPCLIGPSVLYRLAPT